MDHKNTIKAYSLKDISAWQTEMNIESNEIQLPSLQRGFVWKHHQIEALWDSILRGYPIGSVLMSLDKKNNKRFLLDGQQRCTSIALGFFNPFTTVNRKFLSLNSYLPSVWIDINPSVNSYGQKFLIRVLTKSHPWGYRIEREGNGSGKPLTMFDRKNAFEYFKSKEKIERYTDLHPENINPWDSYYPIPLSFLFDTNNADEAEFISRLREKMNKLEIKTKYSNGKLVDYSEIEDAAIRTIFVGVNNAYNLMIPEISVDASVLKDMDEENISEENVDDPTLFIRLNSAGTRIGGEELMYSIYKAAFPSAKDLVENIGASFIAPSKLINLISRLIVCELDEYKFFPRDFNINSFRKKIKEDEFKKKMAEYISDAENCEARKILNCAIKILSQAEDGFSPILIKQFLTSNTELLLVLLIYIKKNDFHIKELSKDIAKGISSIYIYILWFNTNKKVSTELFNLMSKRNSWNYVVEPLIEMDLLIPLVEPELLRKNLVNIVVDKKVNFNDLDYILENNLLSEDIIEVLLGNMPVKDNTEKLKNNWWHHINFLYHNKSLLLFAQREYLQIKFNDYNQFENLEDTNRPWDWDHIYPNSWVYSKVDIHHLVKFWVHSIGNFRALSYDDNRSENANCSPSERLVEDNKKNDSFIIEGNDLEFWMKLDNGSRRIKRMDDTMVNHFLNAVINRMINIYKNWYYEYYK